MLSGGYISLQSESHPIEFRKVEISAAEELTRRNSSPVWRTAF